MSAIKFRSMSLLSLLAKKIGVGSQSLLILLDRLCDICCSDELG